MSKSLKTITGIFALATTSVSDPSAQVLPIPPSSVKIQENQILPPTQQEVVENAVTEFRTSFLDRISRNDQSGPWTQCFSKTGRDGPIEYNPAVVAELRNGPHNDLRWANKFFSSPSPFSIPLSRPRHALNLFPEQKPDEIDRPIVILDPGHGQRFSNGAHETGAIEGGVEEARVADAVASPLANILRSDYGAIVVSTRMPLSQGFTFNNATKFSNQEKSLQMRAEMASFLREKFPGVPVVFLSLHVDRDTVHVDGHGNSGGRTYSYSTREGGAPLSLESYRLASAVAANYRLRKTSYAVTKDLAVLRCQYDGEANRAFNGTAAALVELGFDTNPDDRTVLRSMLNDPSIARKYAQQLASGIGRYLDDFQDRRHQVQMAYSQPQ